jgi:SAM-dependent methyltransferase
VRGSGLEIGALGAPLRVSRYVRVRYVDRMDIADLLSETPELLTKRLVPVDVVDDAEKMSSQSDETADFIIANHVIEHTEDPLGTIASNLRVIRPGGVLYLGVPNRRRTFDIDRQPTPLEHLIRDHEDGPSWSRHAHLEEWAQFVLKSPADRLLDRVRRLDEEKFSIHYHVWDEREFLEMLEYARGVAAMPFEIEAIHPNSHEFVVILRRT